MSRSRIVLVLVLVGVALAACAAGPNDVSTVDGQQLAGFWLGVWHGMIYPVTFVISLFTKSVNVYEVHNNGGWYNFGFVVGIGILHTVTAGPSRAARRRRSNASRAAE